MIELIQFPIGTAATWDVPRSLVVAVIATIVITEALLLLVTLTLAAP